jgi:type I restriction enzyme M protein
MSTIAAIIRDLRNRLHLSQEQLGQRLNVSFSTINRWENGRAEPQGSAKLALNALLEEVSQGELGLRHEEIATEAPSRRRRGTAKSAVLSAKSMEQMLWDAACKIRGEKDAPKFKDYILPLVFVKRLSLTCLG